MTDNVIPLPDVQNNPIEKAWENWEKLQKSGEVLDGKLGTTELYRYYDAWGRLLYVGVSLASVQRLAQHREGCVWFPLIATIKIERWLTRELALLAEKQAIQTEEPYFNRTHAVVLKHWRRLGSQRGHFRYCGDRECNGCKPVPASKYIDVITGLPANQSDGRS